MAIVVAMAVVFSVVVVSGRDRNHAELESSWYSWMDGYRWNDEQMMHVHRVMNGHWPMRTHEGELLENPSGIRLLGNNWPQSSR
jgi:hypothetical protein